MSMPPPSRHCRDARVYGHTTTAMHDIEYTPPPAPPTSNVEGVSIRSRNDVSPRKGFMRGQWSNDLWQAIHEYPPPLPHDFAKTLKLRFLVGHLNPPEKKGVYQ